jgi:hypothetical protein
MSTSSPAGTSAPHHPDHGHDSVRDPVLLHRHTVEETRDAISHGPAAARLHAALAAISTWGPIEQTTLSRLLEQRDLQTLLDADALRFAGLIELSIDPTTGARMYTSSPTSPPASAHGAHPQSGPEGSRNV